NRSGDAGGGEFAVAVFHAVWRLRAADGGYPVKYGPRPGAERMKPFKPAQENAIAGPITTPQYLVYIELDQPYYWSTYADVTAMGQDWSRSGVRVGNVSGSSASLMVENDDYLDTENALSGAYQRGEVRIYWAYTIPDSPYVEEGYWEEGYVSD